MRKVAASEKSCTAFFNRGRGIGDGISRGLDTDSAWAGDRAQRTDHRVFRWGKARRLRSCAQYRRQSNRPPTMGRRAGQPLAPDQLDQLVAPIALYPDALVAQVLPPLLILRR